MELTDFDARIADSDLALSGEGRIDAQTAFGKTCLGVAREGGGGWGRLRLLWWQRHPGGRVGPAGRWCRLVRGHRGPTTVEAAMSAGVAPLERAAERVARLWSLAGIKR